MEVIKNNDYILYNGIVGKVELILGEIVIANVEGVKVKDHISKFKKWDRNKIANISRDKLKETLNKVLDKDYLMSKYENLSESDIDLILTSGALISKDLLEELFGGGTNAKNDAKV